MLVVENGNKVTYTNESIHDSIRVQIHRQAGRRQVGKHRAG